MKTIAHSTLIALAITAGMASGSASAITGTTSVQATFTSTITAGTCTAQIQNAGGQAISTLAFGDVFKSDLVSKSRSEPFKIAFSGCAGVKSATVQATPGTGGTCTGTATDGDSFSAGKATGFEIWKGVAATGTLLSCNTKPTQTVTISGATTNVDMAARIVLGKDKTIADVTTGDVSAPVTFVVTYQ
ncbi:fimbrial protein [Enterobacter quasiroggenkampii]|uniref:fimbrial protein n=1 Tax=Enterobacter quasiroggenkampii TaxID=2497436 RepID=UPI000F83E1A2|nr:fimbrial protein [Enterobacter quasiroggenkampii]RTM79126.1 fimbrial protein [Enterobacter quasiroggenkampii]